MKIVYLIFLMPLFCCNESARKARIETVAEIIRNAENIRQDILKEVLINKL